MKMLSSGKVDVYAQVGMILVDVAARFPGSRMIENCFFAVNPSLAVPKRCDRLAYLNVLTEQVKDYGFVQQLMDRGPYHGVKVAP